MVVKALERDELTTGGIYLPDTVKDKPQEGQVQAVGPGRILEIIESDLPANRTLDVRETPAFLDIALKVRRALRAGHSYE